jgi:ABC-type amino acid transport substrate-binding protein
MRSRTVLLVLACLAVLAAACGTETPNDADTAAPAPGETTIDKCVIAQGSAAPAKPTGKAFKTLKKGVLTVGSDTAFPPFESIEDGKPVGFDIDLVNEIAERIGGLEVDYQTAAFDTIFTALAAGKWDMVASAVTIKAERKQTVDFTDPYFTADQSVSVTDANADTISGVEDLEGKIVGVQAETTGNDCATALKADGKISDVRSYDTAPDAFTDLTAGRVDGVIVDYPTAKQILENRSGSRVVQILRTQEEYGFAVSKRNPDLREAINDALTEITDDGTYARLFMKWFKTEPPE